MMTEKYQLRDPKISLYDPAADWGISRSEKKELPKKITPLVRNWIQQRAIIPEQKEEQILEAKKTKTKEEYPKNSENQPLNSTKPRNK